MPMLGFTTSEDWEEFNSCVLIEVTRPYGVYTCTGVIVGPKLILTAGHCLEGKINQIRVFDQESYDPKAPFKTVKNYSIHPDYNSSKSRYQSDIAKIELHEEFGRKIKIRSFYEETTLHGNIYRFGYGERNKKNSRTVVTPFFKQLNKTDKILELFDQYSYSGDSGGPIYLQIGKEIFLLGIHSTLSFGPQGKFSYNPLVNSFKSWIFQQ
jgi:V8-like Glu-specific endopeptidase